jgi:glycosyltransferase involved in cell wall biosynthesis
MRIVYVCREFGPVTGGGIGTYIYNVSQAMVNRGHDVYLVTDCFNDANRHYLPRGIELVETVSMPQSPKYVFSNSRHEYSYRILFTLRQLSRKINIDVIEFAEFGVEGFASIRSKRVLNEFADTKLIVKLHTPSSLLYHINEDKVLDADTVSWCAMEDYCVANADMVTSPSKSLADYFAKRVGRNDIQLCPYPVALPELPEARQFSREMIKRVRFIGSVQIRKGVDVFIEAAKIILTHEPDFTFEIYGADINTPLFEKPYSMILQSGIPSQFKDKIRFFGSVQYSAIPQLLLDSCFCIFPSRWENWANVCLESMSMGCVAIASECGGMSEMITDGKDGFLIDPSNPQEIADIILAHYNNDDLLRSISQAACLRSKQICDPEQTSLKIENNYQKALPVKKWLNAGNQSAIISVIIPYYNQPEYLAQAVDSVKQSSYKHIEIIVVNDGSTTEEANKAFDQLQGVVKLTKPNGGLSSARNTGIAAASGEFILPLDADDKIHPEYLHCALEALLNHPELAYISCHAHYFGALNDIYIPLGYVPELMPFANTDGKCTNLFRNTVFDRCGGYDEIMPSYEDWDFLITLHENGFTGDILPKEFFFYRRYFNSMVYATANRLRTELIQYMLTKHLKTWEKYAPAMAIILARLWKEAEKRDELAHQQIINLALKPTHPSELQIDVSTRLQIYALYNGGYSEHYSVYTHYPQSKWTTIMLNIPFGFQKQRLRLDPSNLPGTIVIKEITLIAQKSNQILWQADAANQFAGCCVLGNDEHFFYEDCLVIKAADNDPQIMLPELSYDDQQIELSVTLHFGDDFNLD